MRNRLLDTLIALSFVFVLAACGGDDAEATPDGGADTAEDTMAGDAGEGSGETDAGEGSGETDADETDADGTDAGETDAGETDADETDAGETDAGETDAGETDTGETDTGEGSGEADAGGDATPEPENACAAQGGLCLGSTDCEGQGGTLATEGDAGCAFDDGPGFCCVPPAVQPEGDSCAAQGGLCATVGGCNLTGGSFALGGGGCPEFAGSVCCLPESICGEEDVVCCGETSSFRPSCERGTFVCEFEGTTLVPLDECAF